MGNGRNLATACTLLVVLAACGHDPARDAEAIRARLTAWPQAWNARDLRAVCDLFAPDVVLTFPGGPDRDHAAMCAGFRRLFARTDETLRYDPPAITEIMVDGDLAAVRLVWTARSTGAGIAGERVDEEQGLDVFQRQPDGQWRIRVSQAHPRAEPR
ncbi:MAG: nuclear transport factor 2 family protein [bacterium]|nr:nuclear transport factor 2 family protein [bacterium]